MSDVALEPESGAATPNDTTGDALANRTDHPGTLLALLGPVLAYIAYLLVTDPGPKWAAEYFANEKLAGTPVVTRLERAPYIRIYRDPAAPGLPEKGYSARWRTCLVLSEPTEILFQLTSGDGSRLHVDGVLVADNWGRHDAKTVTATRTLAAGTHALRLEHFRHKGRSLLGFNVSFGEAVLEKLPLSMLALPGPDGGCPEK